MSLLIEDNLKEIRRLYRLHGVRKLEAFGSVLRQDFDPRRSNVDVLVEVEPQAANSFEKLLDFKKALEDFLGLCVDLVEPQAIRNRRLRRHVEHSKSLVYYQPMTSEVLASRITPQKASDYL